MNKVFLMRLLDRVSVVVAYATIFAAGFYCGLVFEIHRLHGMTGLQRLAL